LRLVLNREVGKLKIIPQYSFFGADTDFHGAILDAYLEEEEDGETTIYDVEPEQNNHEDMVRALPKRMRFYRAKMDGRGLKAGEYYDKLKKLVMIVITPFDPFGLGRMRYTIRNACVEAPEMPYEDGVMMIFLNTKGMPDEDALELRQFLTYAENSTVENVASESLRQLHKMVDVVKHDEEVAIRYMRLWEEEESIRRKALEEGIEKGIALERGNTEKEKARADDLARKNAELLKKLEQLEGTAFLCKS
jgi:predicted transposase/invertase (TIGR01784 family)